MPASTHLKDIAAKIDAAVRQRWQPQVRKRRRKQAAAATGITVETRARFGYTVPIGTTDDGRYRRLTVHLPATYAQQLFDARDAGASDQQMRDIIAEGFKECISRTAAAAPRDSQTSPSTTLITSTWTSELGPNSFPGHREHEPKQTEVTEAGLLSPGFPGRGRRTLR